MNAWPHRPGHILMATDFFEGVHAQEQRVGDGTCRTWCASLPCSKMCGSSPGLGAVPLRGWCPGQDTTAHVLSRSHPPGLVTNVATGLRLLFGRITMSYETRAQGVSLLHLDSAVAIHSPRPSHASGRAGACRGWCRATRESGLQGRCSCGCAAVRLSTVCAFVWVLLLQPEVTFVAAIRACEPLVAHSCASPYLCCAQQILCSGLCSGTSA